MESVTIERSGVIIAHHKESKALSKRGNPLWSIQESNPAPGRVVWRHCGKNLELNALGVVNGWLVVEQPGGFT